MNCWDMTPNNIGTYDLILQCGSGNIEYLRLFVMIKRNRNKIWKHNKIIVKSKR